MSVVNFKTTKLPQGHCWKDLVTLACSFFFKIKESRGEQDDANLPSGPDEPLEDREVDLKPYASDWDLKLFKEAQALASEDLENSLKGLPDIKNTRYIEMGKNEMEVWQQKLITSGLLCTSRIAHQDFFFFFWTAHLYLLFYMSLRIYTHLFILILYGILL